MRCLSPIYSSLFEHKVMGRPDTLSIVAGRCMFLTRITELLNPTGGTEYVDGHDHKDWSGIPPSGDPRQSLRDFQHSFVHMYDHLRVKR
jgi:hypothetical protein